MRIAPHFFSRTRAVKSFLIASILLSLENVEPIYLLGVDCEEIYRGFCSDVVCVCVLCSVPTGGRRKNLPSGELVLSLEYLLAAKGLISCVPIT